MSLALCATFIAVACYCSCHHCRRRGACFRRHFLSIGFKAARFQSTGRAANRKSRESFGGRTMLISCFCEGVWCFSSGAGPPRYSVWRTSRAESCLKDIEGRAHVSDGLSRHKSFLVNFGGAVLGRAHARQECRSMQRLSEKNSAVKRSSFWRNVDERANRAYATSFISAVRPGPALDITILQHSSGEPKK